jgi:hypothetical protein
MNSLLLPLPVNARPRHPFDRHRERETRGRSVVSPTRACDLTWLCCRLPGLGASVRVMLDEPLSPQAASPRAMKAARPHPVKPLNLAKPAPAATAGEGAAAAAAAAAVAGISIDLSPVLSPVRAILLSRLVLVSSLFACNFKYEESTRHRACACARLHADRRVSVCGDRRCNRQRLRHRSGSTKLPQRAAFESGCRPRCLDGPSDLGDRA